LRSGPRQQTAIRPPKAGTIRSRVLVVFLLVNAVIVGALAVYVLREDSTARAILAESTRIRSGEDGSSEELSPELSGILRRVREETAKVVRLRGGAAESGRPAELRLRRALWDMPLWDEPVLRRHIKRAAVVHRPGNLSTRAVFNVRSDMVFPYAQGDREPSQMVETSLARDRVVWRGDRIAAPIRVLDADWGGVYLEVYRQPLLGESLAEVDVSQSLVLVLLLLIPGLFAMFVFTWRLISTRILEPVESMGDVALRVSEGDYSQRLELPGQRRDEIRGVMVAFNRMLALVEEYRDQMEERVQAAASEIEQKNRELMLGQRLAATGTLASGIAHEINNPLGGMLNVVRRLERDDLTEEQRARYIDILEEGIERIGAIVRKVLAVSPRKMVPTPLNVEEVLGRSLDLVQHRAQRKGVVIDRERAEELPLVLGESNEVGQIFLNLLINAVDACRPEGGRVIVRTSSENSEVRVDIEDNGVGMTPEVAERAFDMFFTTKDAGEGTGLGLATVHSLVAAHGGRLSLQTAPEEGTVLTLVFPAMSEDRPLD